MDKNDKIMIIGGHGKVGKYITRQLKHYNLILVGRNKNKIRSFLEKEKIEAEICSMNIHNIDFANFENVGWVIVCVDQKNTKLVEFCDTHGIDYMDVTANSEYIEKIQHLNLRGRSKILLGVGLAPGLTNLLAENFIFLYPMAKTINIELILGLGEKHGEAAIQWTLDNFLKNYNHKTLGYIRPFTKKSIIYTAQKSLATYNFNFVDQHMLNRKYKDKIFTTYLGFDQSIVTDLIYRLNQFRLLKLLNYKPIYRIAEAILKNPKYGTDLFMVTVQSGEKTIHACGHDEGRFTGLIAAEAARRMTNMNLKNGLLGISDVIHLDDLTDNKSFGLTLIK